MKIKRHSKIIELVQNHEIETQEELADMLKEAGYDVTQATISRDIRELKLMKILNRDGRLYYDVLPSDNLITDKLIRVFCDGVISMDYANNILVIKTLEGLAMAVAASMDSMCFHDMLGCIAGDDTLMCVMRSEQAAIDALRKLNGILKMDVPDRE